MRTQLKKNGNKISICVSNFTVLVNSIDLQLTSISLQFLSVNYIHLVWGGQQLCPNATVTNCNLNHHQVLVTENNCSRCICAKGYYQDHGLGGCNTCRQCKYPFVIRKNCTQTSNTECARCKKVSILITIIHSTKVDSV